jgi:hypothetical protein
VPIATKTDGVWVWPASSAYYLEHHNIYPERDFIEHASAAGFLIPELSSEKISTILDELFPGRSDLPQAPRRHC